MFAVVFTGCKKDDDDNNGGGGTNQWTINGTTYSAIQPNGINVVGSSLTGSGSNGQNLGGIMVNFSGTSLPTTGGSFKIVSDTALDANDEMSVTATVTSGTAVTIYNSTGTDGKTATVAVTDGKMSVTIPETDVKNVTGSEMVKVSGNITQP